CLLKTHEIWNIQSPGREDLGMLLGIVEFTSISYPMRRGLATLSLSIGSKFFHFATNSCLQMVSLSSSLNLTPLNLIQELGAIFLWLVSCRMGVALFSWIFSFTDP